MAAPDRRFGGPLPLEPDSRGRPSDVYGALLRSITGQQLSVQAARAIYDRLLERFGGRPPTPEEILADDPDELRTAAGLSRAKTVALRSLAEHVLAGELQLARLDQLSDEDAIARARRGQGHRRVDGAHVPDVDAAPRRTCSRSATSGVRNAFKAAYGDDADLAATAEAWRPHRTRASLYLWRSLDNAPT